ncbi:MAG: YdbH domain-containing protein, partial [Pseudomonadota bacterium]
ATEVQPELLAGNILTGGPQLPQINARVRQTGTGLSLRMTMAEYRAGGDAFAVPRLEARRDDAGRIRFTGMVQAEGAIPGGTIRGLELPVEGIWSPGAGLALGTDCLDARLAGLEAYDFVLGEQSFALCPIPGEALISYLGSLTIAAQLSDFTATGKVGESPAQITARGATVRYPGDFTVEDVDAVIGAPDNALRLSAGSLSGRFDNSFEGGPNGRFAGATAALDIVPLDLSDLSGRWRFDAGRLTISEGAFDLTERVEPGALARFEPLRSTDAGLVLQGGAIAATAGLVHLGSGRKITDVAVSHDLDLSEGRAELEVPGLIFDAGFQPDELTELTKGLIAFADGTVTGRGSISWNGDELTSTGTFSTDDFDFAAAFGPVRGVKGTIEFTDLLGMTTAPSQVATIASVNPGVEALDGQVTYSIKDGTIITVEDGRWPFMGGELVLRPVTLDYGGGQGQSYIFEIIALDAATFVAQMELANLGASGAFDGTIPIVFDAQGNGTIQGGLLISRPPGGNVSYVGELTYEDLGAMGNYAFQTLRSIDYNQMSIELNGNLAGEIITNFNIDGVRQGEGASQNFITRQLAQLPIRFKINVRSENFYTLATIVRGIFDPTIFGDPVDQGLFQIEGNTIVPRANNTAPGPVPQPEPTPGEAERRNEPSVQPLESDDQL